MTDSTGGTTEHDDYRIGAISEALLEHTDIWVDKADDGIQFDLTLAAIVAISAIEDVMEDEFGGRICRHACHTAQQEDDIKAVRTYAEQFPEHQFVAEQMVLMIQDEAI